MSEYKYILYLKKECPFCIKAENVLSLKDIHYKAIYFDQNVKILEELKEAYNWSTVPMVFQKKENEYTFVGGYTDLLEKQDINEQREQ